MKPSSNSLVCLPRTAIRGFTLVEMVIATTVFTIVILATVAMQIYAMRVYSLAATKMIATTDARMTMNDIRDSVREARIVYVGNYSPQGNYPPVDFSAVTNGGMQEGNALMIYPTTTTTNAFSLIYLQAGNGTTTNFATEDDNGIVINTNSLILLVYTNSVMTVSNVIASYITNDIVFDAENFEGAILSSNENNYLVHMTLDFSQFEYPISMTGTNKFYDYYQLNTVMTRRDTD